MGKTTRLTTEEFIKRSKEIFGNKFSYEKVVYVNNHTKVTIICPEHGEFDIRPGDFLKSKFGCPKCADDFNAKNKRKKLEEFIQEARRIHGNKYDYKKVDYKNNTTKVIIICPEHGEFKQTPDAHLNQKQGCPKCSGKYKRTKEDFLSEAMIVHNNKYDYSKVEYINTKKPVCIICPEHGEFWQTPGRHLIGHGCPKCGILKAGAKNKLTTEEFIKRARKIHGDKYDYCKTDYNGCHNSVYIICHETDKFGNEHGGFLQRANDHLNGCGCPKCRKWILEEEMANLLINNGISYFFQKKFPWLGQQSLDFYLPELKLAIECQGKQHFIGWGSEESFYKIHELDKKKKKLCEKKGINVLYYTNEEEYKQVTDIYNKENTFTSLEKLKDKIFNIQKQ